jgi:hypothetical protein
MTNDGKSEVIPGLKGGTDGYAFWAKSDGLNYYEFNGKTGEILTLNPSDTTMSPPAISRCIQRTN